MFNTSGDVKHIQGIVQYVGGHNDYIKMSPLGNVRHIGGMTSFMWGYYEDLGVSKYMHRDPLQNSNHQRPNDGSKYGGFSSSK